MSESKGISHDTAARLIGVTPADLEKMVSKGLIRRNDKNAYSVAVLVQDYIHFIKTGQSERTTQSDVAAHLDLSERSIRELQNKLNLSENYTLADIRVAYIRHLREQAAGRQSDGELDLVQERAALAREQRYAQELKNAITRKEYAPISLLAMVLANASQSVSDELSALPSILKKVSPDLPESVITAIDESCRKARTNWVHATASLEISADEIDDNQEELIFEGDNGNS